MNAKEFQRELELWSPFTEVELEKRALELRRAGLLPLGSRGPYAKDITTGMASNMFLSLASKTAPAAADVVTKLRTLPVTDDESFGEDFGEAIDKILEDTTERLGIAEVRFSKAGDHATITRDNGDVIRFGETNHLITDEVVVIGAIIHQLANDLTEPHETGEWTAEISAWTGGGGMKAKAAAMEAAKKAQEGED